MCVACDLLTGLDLDATDGPARVAAPLQLPDGNAGFSLEEARTGELRRFPTQGSNTHWAPPQPIAQVAEVFQQAAASYEGYRRAAAEGRVPGDLRWQLSLPSPFTWLSRTIEAGQVASHLQPFQQVLIGELTRWFETASASDVAVQWDLAAETALWESRGRDLTAGRQLAGKVLEGLVDLAEALPERAQLGFHLCRRDRDGETAPDPLDAAQLSHLAGALLASIDRTVDFLHLPAARAQCEPEWYAPYAKLQAWAETELHLGIAWADDTAERLSARMETATHLLRGFGLAPACGPKPVAARLQLQDALPEA
jgi:hypothetical protein